MYLRQSCSEPERWASTDPPKSWLPSAHWCLAQHTYRGKSGVNPNKFYFTQQCKGFSTFLVVITNIFLILQISKNIRIKKILWKFPFSLVLREIWKKKFFFRQLKLPNQVKFVQIPDTHGISSWFDIGKVLIVLSEKVHLFKICWLIFFQEMKRSTRHAMRKKLRESVTFEEYEYCHYIDCIELVRGRP